MVKPWRCPHCRSRSGVPVRYGLPTRDTALAAARGEVVLGGCVLGDDDPRRCCLECRAALWAGGVFAVPGAADDRRIVLSQKLGGGRRLEASVADDYGLTISWRDNSGPAEASIAIPGDDIDLLIIVLSVDLFSDGPTFVRWLHRRGIGFVGDVTGPIDRFRFTTDGMLSFTGPGGDVLVHASVERFILHLVASAYRRQGYRSIAEFREWLAGIGLDIVRSS